MKSKQDTQVCGQEEFARFVSIHDRLSTFWQDTESLSPQDRKDLRDEIDGSSLRLVEIGNALGIALADSLSIVLDMLDDGFWLRVWLPVEEEVSPPDEEQQRIIAQFEEECDEQERYYDSVIHDRAGAVQALNRFSQALLRHFAPTTLDKHVAALLVAGESATVEFKSSARWDRKENQGNKALEQAIVRTVAAFLNTEGGTLLIGVDDDKRPVGLADDYKTLGKRPDRDGYENWLTTLLLKSLGKETSRLIRIRFCELEGCDVCVVDVSPSPKGVYVKESDTEDLYIRTGNSTRQMTSREAVEYVKEHWKQS